MQKQCLKNEQHLEIQVIIFHVTLSVAHIIVEEFGPGSLQCCFTSALQAFVHPQPL